jgi:hypothetical protein
MTDLKLKGRIAEILEGGKVLRQDLFREIKNHDELLPMGARRFDEILKEMVEDGVVKRILVENKKKGRIEEYWRLDE